jgi:hypothetical protein
MSFSNKRNHNSENPEINLLKQIKRIKYMSLKRTYDEYSDDEVNDEGLNDRGLNGEDSDKKLIGVSKDKHKIINQPNSYSFGIAEDKLSIDNYIHIQHLQNNFENHKYRAIKTNENIIDKEKIRSIIIDYSGNMLYDPEDDADGKLYFSWPMRYNSTKVISISVVKK